MPTPTFKALQPKPNEYQGLEVFNLPPYVNSATYTSDEVTAICPVTGQPDQYTVRIQLTQSGLGIESKSLKLYLQTFRNTGIMAEGLASQICEDIKAKISAQISVLVTQKPRGGISIDAHAYSSPTVNFQMWGTAGR